MNIEENKKALKASIRKYRRTVKLLEDNLGVVIERRVVEMREVEMRSVYLSGDIFTSIDEFVSNKRIPYGTSDCPLCILYCYDGCEGCCIKDDTGKKSCDGTPYYVYQNNVMYAKKVGKRLINSANKWLEYLEGVYERLKGIRE